MLNLNQVNLIGNLGQDPEIRFTQGGDPVATLSIATTEKWTDKQSGEKREATEWHRVVVFNALAKVCQDYLQKGSKVYISGKLVTRKWQDKDGNDRYTTEVNVSGFGGKLIMLSGCNDNQGGDNQSGGNQSGGQQSRPAQPAQQQAPMDDLDSEIPF